MAFADIKVKLSNISQIKHDPLGTDTGAVRLDEFGEMEIRSTNGTWVKITAQQPWFTSEPWFDNRVEIESKADILLEELRNKVKEFSLG